MPPRLPRDPAGFSEGVEPRRGGRLGHRVFGQGGLRLVLLQLIADKPCHGYELIRAIEERLQGRYTPSAGVLYPTLAWLEDLAMIEPMPDEETASAGRGARKRYRVTAQGLAYLDEQRLALDALLARMTAIGNEPHERPPQVERAIHNLKMAVHLRLARSPLTEQQVRAFARVLDAAAQEIESL